MRKCNILAVAFEGVEIYDGWEQDGRAFGYNTKKQIVGGTLTAGNTVMVDVDDNDGITWNVK